MHGVERVSFPSSLTILEPGRANSRPSSIWGGTQMQPFDLHWHLRLQSNLLSSNTLVHVLLSLPRPPSVWCPSFSIQRVVGGESVEVARFGCFLPVLSAAFKRLVPISQPLFVLIINQLSCTLSLWQGPETFTESWLAPSFPEVADRLLQKAEFDGSLAWSSWAFPYSYEKSFLTKS